MAQSKWESHVKDKMLLIEGWARDGLTDQQIAKNLGIGYTTLKEYKNKYPSFSATLKRGKEVVDTEVENALLQKALGGKEKLLKPVKLKQVIYSDAGKKLKEFEEIVMVEEEVLITPDTTAQIFWLKNRKPNKWRDKDIEGEKPDGKVTFSFKEAVIKKIEEE